MGALRFRGLSEQRGGVNLPALLAVSAIVLILIFIVWTAVSGPTDGTIVDEEQSEELAAENTGDSTEPTSEALGPADERDSTPPSSMTRLPDDPLAGVGGNSSITVDNTGNDIGVRIKLAKYLTGGFSYVRESQLESGRTEKIAALPPGTYEVRYKLDSTGDVFASQPITLEETETESGTTFSVVSITLYTVVGGNTRMRKIDPSDF